MSFLLSIASAILQWALKIAAKAIAKKQSEERMKEQKIKNEENLKKYKDAIERGTNEDVLKSERDIINGD